MRVAAYLRRSSPGEEDKNYSIESQLADITAWANREGHIIVRSYSDPRRKLIHLKPSGTPGSIEESPEGQFDIVAVGNVPLLSDANPSGCSNLAIQ